MDEEEEERRRNLIKWGPLVFLNQIGLGRFNLINVIVGSPGLTFYPPIHYERLLKTRARMNREKKERGIRVSNDSAPPMDESSYACQLTSSFSNSIPIWKPKLCLFPFLEMILAPEAIKKPNQTPML